MTKKRSAQKATSEAQTTAKELVEQIIQQEPRLKAARNAKRMQSNGISAVEQSLQTFRQRLKD